MHNIIEQEYSSAKTSIKQIPAGVNIIDKYFGWKPNTINLDIGGGKYELMTENLHEKHVLNLVYDPYNRSIAHNQMVLTACKSLVIDTVTIFNVLNVIKEREIQIEVINLALAMLKMNGMLFVRSTYMNKNKVSGVTKLGTFQHHMKQSEYLKIVQNVFPNAELNHGIIFAKKLSNIVT